MKNLLHIFTALVLICSCSSNDKELASSIDWKTELIGVGYIGKNPDSLNSLFSYYPCKNNQPEQLNHQFRLFPDIIGDTIIFPNLLLYDLFRDMKMESRISNDSSSFIMSHEGNRVKFLKISGHGFVPNVVYYKKYPNEYPKKFKYQAFVGFDRWDNYLIEIKGKDSIKIWLKGSPSNPYLYEQNVKSNIDDLFISSYLNLVCDNRYDTTTFNGVIFCDVIMNETLIYNDSIFDYSTYFRRIPDGGILLNYFRSKIDKDVHSLKDFDLELESPFEIRKFKGLPIAIENREILAQP